MIVLGITPGLRALAYSVVGFRGESRGDLIDADVLRGSKAPADANLEALTHKGRPHRLILSVILERHPPAALGLGPPYSRQEPHLHVTAARHVITLLAGAFRVPTQDFRTKQELFSMFGTKKPLRNLALEHVEAESLGQNNALLLATLTAVAAAKRVQSLGPPS